MKGRGKGGTEELESGGIETVIRIKPSDVRRLRLEGVKEERIEWMWCGTVLPTFTDPLEGSPMVHS